MSSKRFVSRALVTGIGLASVACSTTPANTGTRLDDAPMSCTPPFVQYRLTAVDPSQPVAKLLDLDGDGTPDDALGAAHDALAAVEPAFAIAPRFGARLGSDVPWLVSVDRCDDDVRFTIGRGLTLDGGPAIAARGMPRAVGAPVGGVIEARDGTADVPLVALADPSGTLGSGWTSGDGVVLRAAVSDEAITGVFVAAIEVDTARAALAPPLAAFFASLPADDPVRAAAQASDGSISASAIAASALFRELIAGDVIVRAPDGTPRDDGARSISVAFAFTGSRVR